MRRRNRAADAETTMTQSHWTRADKFRVLLFGTVGLLYCVLLPPIPMVIFVSWLAERMHGRTSRRRDHASLVLRYRDMMPPTAVLNNGHHREAIPNHINGRPDRKNVNSQARTGWSRHRWQVDGWTDCPLDRGRRRRRSVDVPDTPRVDGDPAEDTLGLFYCPHNGRL